MKCPGWYPLPGLGTLGSQVTQPSSGLRPGTAFSVVFQDSLRQEGCLPQAPTALNMPRTANLPVVVLVSLISLLGCWVLHLCTLSLASG